MSVSGDRDLSALTSPDRMGFERVLAAISARKIEESRIAEMAFSIATGQTLGHRERDRRLQLLLGNHLSVAAILNLVEKMRLVAPGAANALMALVPPDQRVPSARPEDRPSPGPLPELTAPISTSAPDRKVTPLYKAPDDPTTPTIVLLGSESEHDRNIRVLQSWGFQTRRHEAPVEFRHVIGPDVCGLFISASWWGSLPADQHPRCIKNLILESTFLFLRIATDGLVAEVRTTLLLQYEALIGRPPHSSKFCHGVACDLDDADQVPLWRAWEVLRDGSLAQFHPRGVDSEEAELLRLLAGQDGRRSQRGAAVRVRRLDAGLLAGGRSSARVAIIERNNGSIPLIVKLDRTERLQSERHNYDKWIRNWDTAHVDAQLHCHAGVAALVYRNVGRVDEPSSPAPTLESRLRQLTNDEIWQPQRLIEDERDIGIAIGRAIEALTRLNRVSSGEGLRAFNSDWGMSRLWNSGIQYRCGRAANSSLELPTVLQQAIACIGRLNGLAVVHGDIQNRNVLIRDRDPVFIDFEASGPGHPCQDIASLDTAIMLEAFRMLEGEETLVELFSEIFVGGIGIDELRSRHSRAFACAGNRIALETAVRARSAGVALATEHGGSAADYLAMKFVFCCFGLSQLAPQSGVMRACIRAISEAV